MTRGKWIAAALLILACAACDKKDEPTGDHPSEAPTGEKGASVVEPEGLAGHRAHLDLLELVHLADVDHRGLFIDFGTPARMKYTVGQWRTEWGSDGSSGDTTFTYAGGRGRLYFQADAAAPMTLRLRLRPIGTTVASPYVNGKPLEVVRFAEGSGFRDYDVKVPADAMKVGENQLMLVFGGTTKMGQEPVSVAMESIRIFPAGAEGEGSYEAPTYGTLGADVELAGRKRKAIAVRRPTTLSYYVHVPPAAKLSFGVGAEGAGTADVKVIVRPEGAEPAEIFAKSVSGEWQNANVDLARFAGQIARIDLVASGSGEGRVAWAAPAIMVPEAEKAKPKQAKNVVVLLIDTLRASKLRAFNSKSRVKTPNLDKVAEEGTVFALAESCENWTKPSVASILTSLYPSSHGAKDSGSRLPDSALLVSEHFKANGFTTGSFLANGYVSDKFGFDQGWDHYTNYIREGRSTEAGNVFKEAADWIEANKDKRFFAYIQTIDPHVPYDPPDPFLKMYDDREYAGKVKPRMTAKLLEDAKKNPAYFDASDKRRLEALHDGEISYHDDEMGKFIERMKALGLWEDTLFVVTSDHGEEFGDHGSWGHGHSTFQELLHVPLLFRFPGAVPATRVSNAVSTIDIGPTVFELAGVAPLPTAEGASLADYFRGGVRPGPSIAFSDFLDDRRVATVGRYKLVLKGITPEFYDLEKDPGEQSPIPLEKAPIALRYTRILVGQFLGATDRARWLNAEQGKGVRLGTENAEMDESIKEQLRALGYAN